MFCSQCGTEALTGASFCTKCGNALLKSGAVIEQSNQEPAPVASSEQEVRYAGFWIRYVALLLDGLILGGGLVIFIIGMIILFPANSADEFMPAKYMWLYVILYWLILWGYFIYFTYTKGATLGKRALGLQVVSANSEKLTLEKVIIRETIGRFISHILLDIGYIVAAFTAKKQSLHDTMAGTYVIYKDPKQKTNAWIIAIVLAPIVLAVIGIVAAIVLGSLSAAREKAQEADFKTEVFALNSQISGACKEGRMEYEDLKDIISTKSEYIDIEKTLGSLEQDCSQGGTYTYYFAIQGHNEYEKYWGDCSESRCSVYSDDKSMLPGRDDTSDCGNPQDSPKEDSQWDDTQPVLDDSSDGV